MGAAALARSYFHGQEDISAWSRKGRRTEESDPSQLGIFTSELFAGETCEGQAEERALASWAMCFRIS